MIIDKVPDILTEKYNMETIVQACEDYKTEHEAEFNEYQNKLQKGSYLDITHEEKELERRMEYTNNMDIITSASMSMINTDIEVASEQYAHDNESPIDMLTGLRADPESCKEYDNYKNKRITMQEEAMKILICSDILKNVKSEKYGEECTMTETQKIVEKLEFDAKVLEEGTTVGKEVSIKRINFAIDKIKDLPADYFDEAIPTDKRAKNISKELVKNGKALIEKMYGPKIVESMAKDLQAKYPEKSITMITKGCLLMLYMLSKKIESSMKSKDYKSIIYRAYIIHFMIDLDKSSEEYDKMSKMFMDKIEKLSIY